MFFNILISVIVLVIGVYFLQRALSIRNNIKQAKNWPTITGKIMSSSVKEDNQRTATGRAEYSYIPVISYEFEISGKTYKGQRIIFGKPYFDFITATGLRDKYPEGSDATIYYNPANPYQSVLLPKSQVGIVSWVPGVFFILTGIITSFFTFVKF